MAAQLRHVDPTRPAGWFRRAYAGMAATRAALFVSRHVNWKLDPLLLRITGGRICTTLMIPAAILETIGAKSGQPRKNAVIYFQDRDRVIIAASNGGVPRNPAWFHNLVAHPDVTFGGIPMHATVVDDPGEEARLWPLAENVFPGYIPYRRTAAANGRTIPIVALTPQPTGT